MTDRILIGFDPATRASGWAVLAVGDQEVIRASGVYRAPGTDRLGRLAAIYEFVLGLVDQWAPVLVAVETVYHGPNAATTIKLAEVGAMVRLGAHHAGAAVLDVSPAERVQAIGLSGRPGKGEIVDRVNMLYPVYPAAPPISDDNEADAVAIAAAGAVGLRLEAVGLTGFYN